MVELAGRDVEQEAALRSVRFGAGAVIAGGAGVGKTTLAAAVADQLADQGVPVVRILATAASRSIPFAALGPLLPLDSNEFHPALVPGIIRHALGERAGPHRTLLFVDDAQLLDDHSASALLGLITQGAARALVTLRPGGRPSDAVTALWKDGLLDRIDLHPLDVVAARALLRNRLGDEVAAVTTQLLWEHSQGNPLFLTELVRFGLHSDRLRKTNQVWWWSGGTGVPPRLAELLEDRLDGLSAPAKKACDLLALGEPLPYETLLDVVPADVIMELDDKAIVTSALSGDVVTLRFAHPLLRAVAARSLSAARRRALAGRLITAPADHVDLLRRATWQEAAGGTPDVDLLVRAARSLIVVDPGTSIRFAQRALAFDTGPAAAVTLADAQAELGHVDDAQMSLSTAWARVRTGDDRLMVGGSEAALTLWSLRRPAEALTVLNRITTELPAELVDESRSVAAIVTLFSARPAAADRIADAVLAGPAGPDARRRCLMVRVAAATVADRPIRAREAAAELAELLRRFPQTASARSLSTAIIGTAELFGYRTADLPRAGGGAGRWPAPLDSMSAQPAVGGRDNAAAGPAWPLLEGVRHHLAGDCPAAVTALREATVQQLQGEGLFRSEAAGGLIVALAECGRIAEAQQVLADNPPDDVAVIPGLRDWANAWVLAGSGRVGAAGELAVAVARDVAAVGAVSTAMWYLADASRFGATRAAANAAESLVERIGSDLTSARLQGIRARAQGGMESLLTAAEAHLSVGLFGHAAELADLAVGEAATRSARTADAVAARARGVAATARRSLGVAAPGRQVELPEQLTKREVEIARLAAHGMRDKDIAAELVLSVRTVESHLATVYRKLGIGSRRELVDVLSRPGE